MLVLLSGACALIVMSMAVTIWWTWPTEEDHLAHSLIELAEFTAGRLPPGYGPTLGGVAVNDDPASFICGGAGEPAASGADSLRGRVHLRLVK
jgi:hypothetical protein